MDNRTSFDNDMRNPLGYNSEQLVIGHVGGNEN